MSDTKETGDKKLTLGTGKTLQLKKSVEPGQVRQSISQRRGKSVVVERKRRRVVARDTEPKPAEPEVKEVLDDAGDSHLTEDERAVRAKALEEARKADIERQAREEEEAAKAAEEQKKREAEEAERQKREAEEAKPEEAAEEQAAEPEPQPEPAPPVEAAAPAPKPRAKPAPAAPEPVESEEDNRRKKLRPVDRPKNRPATRNEPRRRERPLTIQRALDDGAEERQRSLAAMRRAREKRKAAAQQSGGPQKLFREVVVPERITVAELANRMSERSVAVVRELGKIGVMVASEDEIDADTAELVITEMGHKIRRVAEADVEIGMTGEEDDPKDMKPRPPVVTVMGHVDHGKTSLLDALRATDVVTGEAGGITQHIGAYQVTLAGGDRITFLDTPGHAAFTAMRARGAQATDLVVLVVAADDGVMPQTIEAIQHAKAADVPIIVAINKIDRPEATPDRVRQELLQHEIVVEGMGGDVLDVEVSALQKTNLDKLEEAIILQSELMELKANPNRPAEGVVVEATLDKGRGSVASVLVTRGSLRVGDVFVAGAEWGRVRALIDDKGNQITEAGPSLPVEVLGANNTPTAGDDFAVVDSEASAREISEYRQRQRRELESVAQPRASLEAMLDQLKADELQEMPIVIKADVQGSAEAVVGALEKMNTDEVAVKVLLNGVGGITESDVVLAEASKAPILAFNVRAPGKVRALAESQGVEIRYYSVIYNLIDDIKAALSGMLAPEIRETILGVAEVKDVFNAGKGKAAGCIVVDGAIRADAKARLLRDDVVVYTGELKSLRRFKDEVKEVNAGTECGMALQNFDDIKAGDLIEVFETEELARSL
ncbi:MAG: translation initiation factor IF-2 [Alphaproteobacteria bacterium]